MTEPKLQPSEFTITLNDAKATAILQALNIAIKTADNSLATADMLLPIAKEIEQASQQQSK